MKRIENGLPSSRSAFKELRAGISSILTGSVLYRDHDPSRRVKFISSWIRAPGAPYRALRNAKATSSRASHPARERQTRRECEATENRERDAPRPLAAVRLPGGLRPLELEVSVPRPSATPKIDSRAGTR